MGNAFCIGQSAYDIIVPIEEPIIENQKYRITEKLECGGGPAFNAAYLCALWGLDVKLISRFGADSYGNTLEKLAKNVGIGLEYMIPDRNIETPHSYIFSNENNGSRTLFNFPGEKSDIAYQVPDVRPDVILSDGHELEITLQVLKEHPKALSVVDAGTCRETTLEVAKHVDYLVCSEDFARQYTGKPVQDPKDGLSEDIFQQVEGINGKNVVITMGDRGLLYRKNGQITHMPAYKVKAIDTNGAGDVFHGGFTYGLSQGLDLEDILKISSMAAAISIQSLGGQPSIPTLEKVKEQINLQSK